jgi:reductive dehalogenase
MLRAAMKFYGASSIYPGELTGKHKNIVNATDRSTPIVFEDVPAGYSTREKHVLPGNKNLYEVGFSVMENREMHRTGPGALWRAANGSRYRMLSILFPSTAEFLRGLGYIFEGSRVAYPLTSGNGAACLHGAAEQARASWWSIDVEQGPAMGRFESVTDLPLEPCRPVDAGIFKFCHACGHCADICPSESVSKDKEPSWELPPSPYTGHVNPGHVWKKIFWTNYASCDAYQRKTGMRCILCRSGCTFNTNRGAIGHDFTRAVVANTPIFNGFFANLFGVFGYGQKDEDGELVGYTWENYARKSERDESWWDMSLPTLGYTTTMETRDGGYRK